MTPFHLQPEKVRVAKFKVAISDMRRLGYEQRPDLVFIWMSGVNADVRFRRLSERI